MEKPTHIATVPQLSPIPPPSVSTASVSFPPSPPSSCGDQSPPPKNIQEVRPLLTPSPSGQNKCLPPQTSLPFSIENILRPDFGTNPKSLAPNSQFSPNSTPEALRTPPKTPEINRVSDTPVDLSHKKSPSITGGAFTPVNNQTKQISTNLSTPTKTPTTSNTSNNDPESPSSNNGRQRYPENPEELANPKVPQDEMVWPAWVYCTRYSDRPSSGPRSRRIKRRERNPEEKRPRTAFTSEQLSRLKVEFENNKYLTEKRRQELARELGLNESQIKIWFQNKRAKIKKSTGAKNGLAQHLMAQGLYNHSTMPVDEDDPYLT